VYIIQKGNMDVEINFYMDFNDEKKKVAKIHRIQDFTSYFSSRNFVLSMGTYWVSW
jgi:hypothetical protein